MAARALQQPLAHSRLPQYGRGVTLGARTAETRAQLADSCSAALDRTVYMTRTRFGCTLPRILEQQRTPRYDKEGRNYARRQTQHSAGRTPGRGHSYRRMDRRNGDTDPADHHPW